MFGAQKQLPSRIGEKWTPEEVIQLRDMISAGKKPREIATELRRCEKGVKSKAYSMKIKFSKVRD